MGPRYLTTETRRRLLNKPESHREHGEMTQRNDEQSLVKSRFHALHCQSPRPTSRNPLQKRGKERPVRQALAVVTMADSISKKLLFQSLSVFRLCALRVSVVECQGRRRRPHHLICPWFTPGHGEDPPALPGPATNRDAEFTTERRETASQQTTQPRRTRRNDRGMRRKDCKISNARW